MSSNPSKAPHSGIPKPSSMASTAAGSRIRPAPRSHSTVSRQIRQPDAPPAQSKAPTPVVPPNWKELEEKYKQDIETLTESTEMATIEKEIAEEKLDGCERELQETKDKLAEASLQIEMLKGEQVSNQSVIASTSDSAVTVLQLQKVEEQNELLRQALIKLRDMSAKDKKSLEDLQNEHEELQEKVLDLEEKEQKYLEQIKIFEEQIDVSQSAQEMVEKMTQQKTELEDKLKEMIDDFDCMEKLRDLNEQLLENARENEIELTNELDKLRCQYTESIKRKQDMEDYLTDQERTMSKLKDENRQLTDQVSILREQFKEGESIEQQKHQIENVAYKLNFSESKMLEKEAEIARYKRKLSEMEEQMNNLSSITKEQAVQMEELNIQYDAKTSENSDLQRALKKKMEEISELEIRKDLAEKRLQHIQEDTEVKLANLKRDLEKMKGKEIQYEEEIKRLTEDFELIERERRDLRDQLNKSNRSLERSMQPGNHSLTMMTAQDTSLASLGISFQSTPSSQASPLHQAGSTLQAHNQLSSQRAQTSQSQSIGSASGQNRQVSLTSEVDDSCHQGKFKDIGRAFEQVNRKNYELELELALHELNSHAPPYSSSNISNYYDMNRARQLYAEVQKLKREVRATVINQQICPNSRNIFSQTRNEKFNYSKLALRYQMLENEANAVLSSSSLSRTCQKVPFMQSTPVK